MPLGLTVAVLSRPCSAVAIARVAEAKAEHHVEEAAVAAKPREKPHHHAHGTDVGVHAREDSINRVLSLFASAPKTLESPDARELLAQVRAMAEGRGAHSIEELARVAAHDGAHPPARPPLMRRATAASDNVPHRQQGKAEEVLVQGRTVAAVGAEARQFPPLPVAAPDAETVALSKNWAASVTPSTDTSDKDAFAVQKVLQNNHVDFPLGGTTTTAPWWTNLPAYLDDVPPPGHYDAPEVPEYWIEDGCRYGVGHPLQGNYSKAHLRVAKVQCCTTGKGPACLRKMDTKCLMNEDPSMLYTHDEAKQVCESSGMRMCSKKEMHDSPDSLGCCGTGCGMDDLYTWTNTLSSKSELILNRKLTKRITDLRGKNLGLLKEHLSEELRLEFLKNEMNEAMWATTTPLVTMASSEEVDNVITKNDALKTTYDVLKEENEMLRKRLEDMMDWSHKARVVAPRWFDERKSDWKDTSRYSARHVNNTYKDTPAEWEERKRGLDLHWVHRYDEKDVGWRWTTVTTTPWYRHDGDNKHHGRMGAYDSWPPDNKPGDPDSEFWPVEKPVPSTTPTQGPEWLPQPAAKGAQESYDEAHHRGEFDLHYEPLWNRYR